MDGKGEAREMAEGKKRGQERETVSNRRKKKRKECDKKKTEKVKIKME